MGDGLKLFKGNYVCSARPAIRIIAGIDCVKVLVDGESFDVEYCSGDKRHRGTRSSSSLAGAPIEGTRSERKLDVKGAVTASIPEVDDQFSIVDTRCDELQEKIDLVKALKRKRKLKKRSLTKMVENSAAIVDNMPMISVHTQPKKKMSDQMRVRRLAAPANPTRGYLDPATLEQHRMVGQMTGYQEHQQTNKRGSPGKTGQRVRAASGDSTCQKSNQITTDLCKEVACGDDDDPPSDRDDYDDQRNIEYAKQSIHKLMDLNARKQKISNRRRYTPRESITRDGVKSSESEAPQRPRGDSRRNKRLMKTESKVMQDMSSAVDSERPVVELFSKSRARDLSAGLTRLTRSGKPSLQKMRDDETGHLEIDVTENKKEKESTRYRRMKFRSPRYELPTVASQMKQAGVRCYYGNGHRTNIPFVVSKSTAPSHNIGVNIQQVLSRLKTQQPLTGIPLTMAHHMGLRCVPHNSKSAVMCPDRDNHEINVLQMGRRLVRLPSCKRMSYSRVLALYREGEGLVPRFLRTLSRPQYFYTSMYNLPTHKEYEGSSKGRGYNRDAKEALAEYAALYKEYEQLERKLEGGALEPGLRARRDDLARELGAKEEHIRQVVQEYRTSVETDHTTIRATSTTDSCHRHSTFQLNTPGDAM